MNYNKIIVEGKEARAKLLKGALTVSRILGSTLGPNGRNAIIYQSYSAPKIMNDGGEIARHIVLNDEIEDLGAQTAVESTMKTNDRAGDGRSTTAVFQGKILEICANKISEDDKGGGLTGDELNSDVIGMSKDILDQKDIVIEKLKVMARPLKKGELKNVVSTSLGRRYPEYVAEVTNMVEQTGIHGYVSVEDNWGTKYGVESTLILGMRFLGSYSTPVVITDMKKKESVFEDTYIFITNHRIETSLAIANLIKELREKQVRKLVIIAEGYEKEFVAQVSASYYKQAQEISKGNTSDFFKILPIKAPSLTTEQFEDVAVFVGAKLFNKNLGDNDLSKAGFLHLGKGNKIIVDEDNTIITGGQGDAKDRIKLLTEQLDEEKDSAFKEQLKRRIGAMASGFGIIRVGASTEGERVYVKKKIEDAVNAAKAALEEGVVLGGGLALQKIGKELGKDNILYEALLEPHKKICANCGVSELKVPATVVDALKVTRMVVENGCVTASSLITCEVAISTHKKTLLEELQKAVAPQDNDDHRADENIELGYRT